MTPSGNTPRDRSRQTLRSYFADGCRPTGAQFAELIESVLNMQDEGFAKTPDEGLKITSAANQSALLTFLREEQRDQGLWSVRYGDPADPGVRGGLGVPRVQGGQGAPLAVAPLKTRLDGKPPRPGSDRQPVPLVVLHQNHRVSVGKSNADHMLDVQGVVAARGRVGTYPQPGRPEDLTADGQWKDATDTLEGCVALEVVATVSAEGSGHHAIMRAVAMNAYNPEFTGVLGWLARRKAFEWIDRRFNRRRRIRCEHVWFGESCDRLELRWCSLPEAGARRPYKLQIRTRCRYPGTTTIQLHVTELWPADTPSSAPAPNLAPAQQGGA